MTATTTNAATGPLTARHMLDLLRAHYLPPNKEPGGIFAPEIQAPGRSNRRADLIWQGCTAAWGTALVGHEIKITRRDLLAELDDPTKSHPWQQYCHQWWLVVPDLALTDGLELPPTWGVMTPPSGRRTRSMTIAVPAPALHPDDQAPALRTLATWLHWRLHRSEEQRRTTERDLHNARAEIQHARANQYRVGEHDSPLAQFVKDVVVALADGHTPWRGQVGPYGREVTVEDVVTAIQDLAATRHAQQDARNTLDSLRFQLRRLRTQIDTVLAVANTRPGKEPQP